VRTPMGWRETQRGGGKEQEKCSGERREGGGWPKREPMQIRLEDTRTRSTEKRKGTERISPDQPEEVLPIKCGEMLRPTKKEESQIDLVAEKRMGEADEENKHRGGEEKDPPFSLFLKKEKKATGGSCDHRSHKQER